MDWKVQKLQVKGQNISRNALFFHFLFLFSIMGCQNMLVFHKPFLNLAVIFVQKNHEGVSGFSFNERFYIR
mgnify:CR=1 FL=1